MLETDAERRELVQVGGASGMKPSERATFWPDGNCHVRWRKRFRCGSDVGPSWLAIAPRGRLKSGVESFVSIRLFGLTWPSPKSKNVCQPTKRRGARAPPRMSPGSLLPSCDGSKTKAKNGPPLSPARFARYDGRTMLWPIRYVPVWNSTGMNASPGRGL